MNNKISNLLVTAHAESADKDTATISINRRMMQNSVLSTIVAMNCNFFLPECTNIPIFIVCTES